MHATPTPLNDLLILTPVLHTDARGSLFESFQQDQFRAATGCDVTFFQDNHTFSHRHVLRGLHYQSPVTQGKLVRVTSGVIFDVAVDLRRSSSTFGQWFGLELSAQNRQQLWVPAGFAHGFLTLSETSDVLYKITAPYDPASQHRVRYDDPDLGITWPLTAPPLLSEADMRGHPFAALEAFA